MDNNESRKIRLPIYTKVITDINVDLIADLNKEEKAFYEGLDNTKQDRFLNMSHLDRAVLMDGKLSEEEKETAWKYASTLALKYINKGFMLKDIIDKISPYAKIFLALTAVSLCADFYFNTYAKNRQLHVESLPGKPKYELVPSAINTINANKQNINEGSNLMDVAKYKEYISSKGFECGKLESLNASFFQSSGKPLCKQGLDGDVFVGGYVLNPTYPQPTFNVIHQGKVFNIDLNNDAGISVAELPGLDKVNFKMISYTFQAAFPEAVREAKTDVVTKNREGKE